MSDLPDRLWTWYDPEFGVYVSNTHGDKRYTPDTSAEYVRADLAERQLREAALQFYREAGLRYLAAAIRKGGE